MDLDSNFTALLIALVVISLLVGLAIYYNIPHSKNVQSLSQNSLGKPDDKSVSLSQGGKSNRI